MVCRYHRRVSWAPLSLSLSLRFFLPLSLSLYLLQRKAGARIVRACSFSFFFTSFVFYASFNTYLFSTFLHLLYIQCDFSPFFTFWHYLYASRAYNKLFHVITHLLHISAAATD